MKFVAIGTHPPLTLEEQAATDPVEVAENLDYCRAQLASHTYECVCVMEGVGRFIIGYAETEAEFLKILQQPPDHPQREWKINRLLDYEVVITDYMKEIGFSL
jgi:hypothetical protein